MPCCFTFSLSLTLIFSADVLHAAIFAARHFAISIIISAVTPPPSPFRYASPPRFSPFHAFAADIDAVCSYADILFFFRFYFDATPLPCRLLPPALIFDAADCHAITLLIIIAAISLSIIFAISPCQRLFSMLFPCHFDC
jgi:hypothetical protein